MKLSPYKLAELGDSTRVYNLNPDEDADILLTLKISERERKLLTILWEELKKRHVLQNLDSIGLSILVNLMEHYNRLNEEVKKKGYRVETKYGTKPSPEFTSMLQVGSNIIQVLKQYGMTPSARKYMEKLIAENPTDSELEKLLNETGC